MCVERCDVVNKSVIIIEDIFIWLQIVINQTLYNFLFLFFENWFLLFLATSFGSCIRHRSSPTPPYSPRNLCLYKLITSPSTKDKRGKQAKFQDKGIELSVQRQISRRRIR